MNLSPLSRYTFVKSCSNGRSCRTKNALLLILLLTWSSSLAKNQNKAFPPLRETNVYIDIIHDLKSLTIPERLDTREIWYNCPSISSIPLQGACNGGWAFAASSAMTDRLCITTNGTFNGSLSVQDLLECCTDCVGQTEDEKGGCQGGNLHAAYYFALVNGIVTGGDEGCKPLPNDTLVGFPIKDCREECKNGYKVSYSDDKKFPVVLAEAVKESVRDLRHIQAEIMLYGPVSASMTTYDYVFHRVEPNTILYYNASLIHAGETARVHSVKVIGWDKINDTSVWIIANSWGTSWGDNGFGYIRMGHNDFGIENEYNIVAGYTIDGRRTSSTSTTTTTTTTTEIVKPTETSGGGLISCFEIVPVALLMLLQ